MVLCHIGRRHEDGGLSEQFEFADRSGAGARYHDIGGGVGRSHVIDERGHHYPLQSLGGIQSAVAEMLAGLPDHLCATIHEALDARFEALVDGQSAE